MMKMKMVLFCLVCFLCSAMTGDATDVTYDGRSLMFNGTRKILFSGSIHYPRSTPQMWPSLIAKAKQGGLDVIQTYVFWNMHEPKQGQHNFEGRLDLVSFIKEIQSQGLYVSLRIGPFIESEWQYGGLPLWLHDVPGIVFRSDNEPFKIHMQNFTTKIVNMMKAEGLYASQGGPIILSQIENEYKNVEAAFHERGPPYVQWAADMAVGLQTGVPWVMCKQPDAPDPVINACNGMNCGETFTGPNSPNKPAVWTENWTSFYQAFGEEPFLRSAEDIAFAVALWIAKNGSFVNYYMYHGGTNFARTGSAFVTTSYYDQAPLDEYGLIRQPKWGHLRELHIAIKQGAEPLLLGTPTNFSLGQQQDAYVFQGNLGCIAFLSNSDKRTAASVQFRNSTYELPRRSISILSDCKNVIFNTAKVNAQYGERSVSMAQNLDVKESWEEFMDGVPSFAQASFKTNALSDQIGVAKDDTDYLWYSISYDHATNDSGSKLHVDSRGHVVHAFVNGMHIGTAHGSHKNPITTLEAPISLISGNNNISLLSVLVGLPDSGAFMERKVAGLRRVIIQDNNNRSEDISTNSWGYQIGLLGEQLGIYAQDGLEKVNWKSIGDPQQPLTWYKTLFDAPEGNDSVVLNLGSMGKGEAWINGENIGRYWISFNTPKGRPSQTLYHVPRSFLKPSGNLLVLFEEIGGDPLQISFGTPTISRICGSVSDKHLPPVWSLGKKRNSQPSIHLQCAGRGTISSIEFASFGTPLGDCASYTTGSCHSVQSRSVAEEACLGKNRCSMTVLADKFGEDPCPGTSKSLLVVANCS